MRSTGTTVFILLLGLISIYCSNLQTDSQVPLCPPRLKMKIMRPAKIGRPNRIDAFVRGVIQAPDAMTVVQLVADLEREYMQTFFSFAQFYYQLDENQKILRAQYPHPDEQCSESAVSV